MLKRLTLRSIGAHAVSMIRLTLPDGTRTQLEASEITDVEPVGGGSLVHLAVGEPMNVMQDARTIQTRINAELQAANTDIQVSPVIVDEAAPTSAATPQLAKKSAPVPAADPIIRMHRLKGLMLGRVSGMALTIAQTTRV